MRINLNRRVTVIGKRMADAVTFNTTRILSLTCLIVFTTFPTFAKPPVLVEMFSHKDCRFDTQLQEDMQALLKKYENVIFVNCRNVLPNQSYTKHSNSLCFQRSEAYGKRLNTLGDPIIVVNGKWDAFIKDVAPAIEMGETDNLQKISIDMSEDNLLNISVPAPETGAKKGALMLYIYGTTQQKGQNTAFVDADIELTQSLLEDILQKKSVPFVTPSTDKELYVRPVISIKEIGQWNGTALNMSIPLNKMKIMAFLENSYKDLNYVVSLHENDRFGPVLATGELMSSKEMSSALPHSTPLDLQFVSQPDPAVLNSITQ